MFWPFRLLIAAVMSFAILVIILGAVNYFNEMKVHVSRERMYLGFENALGAITTPEKLEKGLKKEENLTIQQRTISTSEFAKKFSMQEECISMQVLRTSSFELLPNEKAVVVKQESVSDMYFLCVYDYTDVCEERCFISFGAPPEV